MKEDGPTSNMISSAKVFWNLVKTGTRLLNILCLAQVLRLALMLRSTSENLTNTDARMKMRKNLRFWMLKLQNSWKRGKIKPSNLKQEKVNNKEKHLVGHVILTTHRLVAMVSHVDPNKLRRPPREGLKKWSGSVVQDATERVCYQRSN
jgi:hypothetical protein